MSYEAPPSGGEASADERVWALVLATNGHRWPKLDEPLIPWAADVLNRLEEEGYVMVKRGEAPEQVGWLCPNGDMLPMAWGEKCLGGLGAGSEDAADGDGYTYHEPLYRIPKEQP